MPSDLQGSRAILSYRGLKVRGMEGDFTAQRLQPGVKGWIEDPWQSETWLRGAVVEDERQPKHSHRWQENFSCRQSSRQRFKPDPPHPSAACAGCSAGLCVLTSVCTPLYCLAEC